MMCEVTSMVFVIMFGGFFNLFLQYDAYTQPWFASRISFCWFCQLHRVIFTVALGIEYSLAICVIEIRK